MQLNHRKFSNTGIFINNKWQTTDRTFPVFDPATGKLIVEVSDASTAICNESIDAATSAFASWSITTAKERSAIMKKWYSLVMQYASDIAQLLTLEQGKPLSEAKGEVIYGASFIEWNAEECKRTYGEVIPSPVASKKLMTIKQPVGVVAAITPWNFPVAMITRKVAPAIAAGCTVVLKPAEDTPLCALAF